MRARDVEFVLGSMGCPKEDSESAPICASLEVVDLSGNQLEYVPDALLSQAVFGKLRMLTL